MKKEAIFPAALPKPVMGYSPVVKAGPLVFVSGQVASDFKTGVPPEARTNARFPHHGSNIERQTAFIANKLEAALGDAGSSLANAVFLNLYHTHAHELHGALKMLQQAFGAVGVAPHASMILEELPVPGCTLEVDAIGFAPEHGERLEFLNPASLPPAVPTGLDGRPLHHYGVKAGSFIFTAGITATDFNVGVAPTAHLDPNFIYYGEAARLQTEYILETLQTILNEGGASMDDVVKADIYLTDCQDFYRVEQVWKQYFPTDPPARTTVPVTDLGVPGLRVAINLVAYVPNGGPAKRTIHTDAAPAPLTHEPQAVQAGPFLFLSNQLATDYRTGVAPEAQVDPNFPFQTCAAERQLIYIAKNVEKICQAAGTSREQLIRRRGLYADFDELFTSLITWTSEFRGDVPAASTTVRVASPLLVPGCQFAFDMIALVPDGASG